MTDRSKRDLFIENLTRYDTTFEDTRFVRSSMIDTLIALRAGEVGATEANAAARLGEVVVNTLHTQLRVIQELGNEARMRELPALSEVIEAEALSIEENNDD